MSASATDANAVSVRAPAKINLALQVCGRRADNYHLLDSLVVFADVGDRITVTAHDKLELAVTGRFAAALAQEPDNLVLRAARYLAARHKIDKGARISLEKNLPVASGVGGGSADAAATLRACARLWGVDAGQLADGEIAAGLGADVPVCLSGVPAFMSGIGEIIAPAPALPPAWLVLANPGAPLATRAVFAALAGRFSPALSRDGWAGLKDAGALAKVLAGCRNDLTTPALTLLPAIGAVLEALAGTAGCLLARLSGSGPTCFGLYSDAAAAKAAAAAIAAQRPAWWTAAAAVLAPGAARGNVS